MFKKSICLTAAVLALALVTGAGAQELGQGKVLFEYWFGGGVDSNLDNLKANADFPDNPAQSEWRDGMDHPDWAGMDYWGARARAFLTPTESGDYTFWVASDDDSELWLSTDDDPANAVMIASVEGWTNYAVWDGSQGAPGDNQQSDPITLEAGKKYYIEMLFSDGTGGGHGEAAWAGPGIGDTPTILAGDVLTALIRDPEPLFQAQNPKPASGAIDITNPMFEWTAGITAVAHDIYFGTTPELTDADFVMQMPAAMYYHLMPLVPSQTYYWRVDEVDAAGVKYTGDVWSFTVMPLEANTPSPADGASFVSLTPTLRWKAGQAATTHDVYVGADMAAVEAGDASVLAATVQAGSDPNYTLADLQPETTYYWRVDEVDGIAGPAAGPVWSFSTVPLVEKVDDPNLVGWWTFDTEPASAMAVLDMSGNSHYGALVGDGLAFVQDPFMGGVLELPGGDNNYVKIGSVGISGNDPTTIACWAKANSTSIPDWTLIFGFTTVGGGNGSHFNIGSLGGPGGVGAHCWGWEETIFSDNEALEWHHYAMTYDGTTITYYGDGLQKDTDEAKSNVQDLSIRGDNVQIGSRITQASSFPGRVDDCRVYNTVLDAAQITELAMAKAAPIVGPADITSPRDIVTGIPDDGNWPGAESPMLAVDNRTSTKFLHFDGQIEPTGVQISPYAGPTIVTGLTFTTANDAEERDPVTYELYGANGSDPWTLIAAGDIVDFNQPDVWPRFTKNATPITFDNSTAYEFYQVIFPTVRDPNTANSMQIGEIELLGGTTSQIISMVVRSNGQSGDRDPVGAYDDSSKPLATEVGALMDGNLVFSDRTYPWIDTPAELVGAEYVRTFNSDKNGGETDVTYTITTSREATIALTVDDRIPAEWSAVASQQEAVDKVVAAFAAPGTFTDTGLDLFIRENDTTFRQMSVYSATLPAGTYTFGGQDSGKNFYTIGAME